MTLAAILIALLASVLLLAAALHDVAVRTVPNSLIASISVPAVALAALQSRLMASLAVGAVALVFAAFLWLRRYLGGADAKLLAVAAFLVPPWQVPAMLLATALAGGLLCMPYLLGPALVPPPGRRPAAGLIRRAARCERWRLRRRGPLPYAVAIAAGTLFALLQGA